MALSPASWVHHTTSLRMGDRVRVDHDCGAGRTLTVRRDERGLHAFCFRCNDSGWQPPEPEPLEVRLARLAAANTEDTLACTSVGLPAPMVRSWARTSAAVAFESRPFTGRPASAGGLLSPAHKSRRVARSDGWQGGFLAGS